MFIEFIFEYLIYWIKLMSLLRVMFSVMLAQDA